jgi:hypothetical protein
MTTMHRGGTEIEQVTRLSVGLVAGHLGEGLVELLADGLELLLLVAQLIFPGRYEHVPSLKTWRLVKVEGCCCCSSRR